MKKTAPSATFNSGFEMKLAIIGTGYIGLVSGVCLAKIGHDVTCVDFDMRKIEALKKGQIPIHEPGLADMMDEVLVAGRLHFTTDTLAATRAADAVFIGVGTPTSADGASSDLTYVFGAAADIAKGIDRFKVIVVKSTVPVGTCRKIAAAIKAVAPHAEFEVASNPEFLREGAAIFDFLNPDRIVIGTEGSRAQATLDEIYQPFAERQHAVLHTSIESAELIKLAANGFLATKIAFINEIAGLCEKTGANVHDVARGMGLDNRIGAKFLNAGPGYGGSCFPKDTRALAALGREKDFPLSITEAVVDSNLRTKQRMVQKIVDLADGSVKNKRITVFGVTFKADTDDMREAPALDILPALSQAGAEICVVDPEGQKHGQALLPFAEWRDDPYEAATDADLIVVLTEWREFRTLDLSKLARSMRYARLADLRNIYTSADMKAAGFERYCQVGS
jgi:UDPglucose 6-dehydrogenase